MVRQLCQYFYLLPYMVIELHKYQFAENAEFEWVFKKMPGA
jgi:hypothetical protein